MPWIAAVYHHIWNEGESFLVRARELFGPNLTQWSICQLPCASTEAIFYFSSGIPSDLSIMDFAPDWTSVSMRAAIVKMTLQIDPLRYVSGHVSSRINTNMQSQGISWLDVYDAAQDLYSALGSSDWDHIAFSNEQEIAAQAAAIAVQYTIDQGPKAVEAALVGIWAPRTADPELGESALFELLNHVAKAADVGVNDENRLAAQVMLNGANLRSYVLGRCHRLLRAASSEISLSDRSA
jgi:hypothetical protein